MADTRDEDYSRRLSTLQQKRWKSVLGAQVPYRWNVRRLFAGRERILDVGCGIGRNLLHLGRGVGVDHNATSVQECRDQGLRAYTTQEWPESPEAHAAPFDGLLIAHVLEHLDEPTADQVVQSYLPYLTMHARLVLICPQERGYASDATHVRWTDGQTLSESAVRWGFKPIRNYSFPLPRALGKAFTYNEFVLCADRVDAQRAHHEA